jgi:hypothetical protein
MSETPRIETPRIQPEYRAIADELTALASTWARYGLSVGRLALETSSRSLAGVAELLGTLAHRFEEPAQAPRRDTDAA